nr:MAG TPA: protein of unknown function (DUF1502) [Caudoviricetes sp.]
MVAKSFERKNKLIPPAWGRGLQHTTGESSF